MAIAVMAPMDGAAIEDETLLATHPIYGIRPRLRGRIHQVAAIGSVMTGVHLVLGLSGPASRIPTLAYAATCTLMFGTSAAYHRLAHGVLARFWMRRLDHTMILLHIAGTTTAIALLGVGGFTGRLLAATSCTLGLLGGAAKMIRLTTNHDPCHWLFAVMGWLPLLSLPTLASTHGLSAAALLVGATGTYTVGAVLFSRKSLDPLPKIFGYHEVWHVFTVIAGTMQLLLVAELTVG